MATINVLRVFVHLVAFFVMAAGTWMDTQVIQFGWDSYAGKWKYLTFWDLWLQTLYFGMCLSRDIIDWKKKSPGGRDHHSLQSLQKFIDQTHAMFVFPIGMFVVITFWAIYLFDRELIFPSYLDSIIPAWLNHIMHTFPLFFLLMDKWTVHHRYPSKRRGLLGALFFTSVYTFWILWLAFLKGIWVYPVLEVLELKQRFFFIGVLWMFVVSIYLLGESLTIFLWRKHQTTSTTTTSVSKKSNKQS